ncbi:MAG: hypothetical protein ABW068_06795 [Candidatus Thiodiazotropha sp.]
MKQYLYLTFHLAFLLFLLIIPTEHIFGEVSQVPKLNIRWDCGSCTQNPKVIPLIQQAYADEAHVHGQKVSQNDVAEVSIVDFRQRNPGARVMLGIMAGKDRLGLMIDYKGQTYTASDTSANTIQGMNHLCASAASETYRKLSAAVD